MRRGLVAYEAAMAGKMLEDPEHIYAENEMDLLDKIVREPQLPIGLRVNAAKILMEYRHPRLSAMAVLRDESSFAKALERANERTDKIIEHEGAGNGGAGKVPAIIDANSGE
jgi:hypothetical protein